jgi:hypothetical protein
MGSRWHGRVRLGRLVRAETSLAMSREQASRQSGEWPATWRETPARSGGRTSDSDEVSVARESEAGASSPGRNIPGNEQRTGFQAIWQTAGYSERDSWLGDSEVRASRPGRNILGIEHRTVVQCCPAGGRATRTRSQSSRESEAGASSLGKNIPGNEQRTGF